MNSYTKITLILLLSSLTTFIHTAEKPAKEMAQQHEDNANTACKIAEMSFTSLFTNGCFEMLYKELDKKGHVPANWQFFRRINKPMMAVAGVVLVGASSEWFYHASLAEDYKTKSKKWFWQR